MPTKKEKREGKEEGGTFSPKKSTLTTHRNSFHHIDIITFAPPLVNLNRLIEPY